MGNGSSCRTHGRDPIIERLCPTHRWERRRESKSIRHPTIAQTKCNNRTTHATCRAPRSNVWRASRPTTDHKRRKGVKHEEKEEEMDSIGRESWARSKGNYLPRQGRSAHRSLRYKHVHSFAVLISRSLPLSKLPFEAHARRRAWPFVVDRSAPLIHRDDGIHRSGTAGNQDPSKSHSPLPFLCT